MQVQPYVCFEGRCDEAIEFYRKAVGAELTFRMRFNEMPGGCDGHVTPGAENKVMHASLKIGNSTVFVSDGRVQPPAQFKGIMLSIQTTDAAQAERAFTALADGGQVFMPLTQTFWSPKFGMLTDRFGVTWMVNVNADAK
jgi:PhnB protein